MRVLIVTSVLNAAAVLPKCIESVKSQTYPCEHVIVDGGSVDGSQEIAREVGVRVIDAFGSNISEAFNIGIQSGSGHVIAILNADDWLENDAAERSARALEENPHVGFTYGSVVVHYPKHDLIVSPRMVSGDLAPHATRRMLFYHISSFVRRSVYIEHGLFDPKFKVAMDYDFYARITMQGVQGVYVPGIIAHALSGGASSHTRARMRDYYHVLSRYYGKAFALYSITKYSLNSFLYGSLPADHAIWRMLNSRSNRRLVDRNEGWK